MNDWAEIWTEHQQERSLVEFGRQAPLGYSNNVVWFRGMIKRRQICWLSTRADAARYNWSQRQITEWRCLCSRRAIIGTAPSTTSSVRFVAFTSSCAVGSDRAVVCWLSWWRLKPNKLHYVADRRFKAMMKAWSLIWSRTRNGSATRRANLAWRDYCSFADHSRRWMGEWYRPATQTRISAHHWCRCLQHRVQTSPSILASGGVMHARVRADLLCCFAGVWSSVQVLIDPNNAPFAAAGDRIHGKSLAEIFSSTLSNLTNKNYQWRLIKHAVTPEVPPEGAESYGEQRSQLRTEIWSEEQHRIICYLHLAASVERRRISDFGDTLSLVDSWPPASAGESVPLLLVTQSLALI